MLFQFWYRRSRPRRNGRIDLADAAGLTTRPRPSCGAWSKLVELVAPASAASARARPRLARELRLARADLSAGSDAAGSLACRRWPSRKFGEIAKSSNRGVVAAATPTIPPAISSSSSARVCSRRFSKRREARLEVRRSRVEPESQGNAATAAPSPGGSGCPCRVELLLDPLVAPRFDVCTACVTRRLARRSHEARFQGRWHALARRSVAMTGAPGQPRRGRCTERGLAFDLDVGAQPHASSGTCMKRFSRYSR